MTTRAPLAVLLGAVVLLVAILAVAVRATLADPGPGGGAAQLVPASALAFARLSTDPGDRGARRLVRLAPKLPGYLRLRDAALAAISPTPGAFDLRRDVRPWLGDEAGVALVDLGGGRFGSLVIAQVRNRPRAEALLRRIAGARPGTRYGKTVVRRFGSNAAAFVRGFLVAGPELAVQRSIDVASGDAPSLARSRAFRRALEGSRRPAELYVAPRGLRARGGLATLLDFPRLRALGAAVGADARGLHVRARAVGSAGAQFRPSLVARVPASAVALVAAPDLGVAVAAAQRAGAGATLDAVRKTLRDGAALDLDRDVLGKLHGGFAAWVAPGAAAPAIGLAAHTSDPGGLRVVLARMQDPVARLLAADADAPPVFATRKIAGADAYTLSVTEGFAPTYAVAGDTAVLATTPSAVEAFLDRAKPRLLTSPGFRTAIPQMPPRMQSLGFFDVRQLLALGEQTGLTAEDLRPVHAASAVIQREEDDTTAELFFEIP